MEQLVRPLLLTSLLLPGIALGEVNDGFRWGLLAAPNYAHAYHCKASSKQLARYKQYRLEEGRRIGTQPQALYEQEFEKGFTDIFRRMTSATPLRDTSRSDFCRNILRQVNNPEPYLYLFLRK